MSGDAYSNPQIIQVVDDVAAYTGLIGDGGFTNDATPTVRVSLAGTAAQNGGAVQLQTVYGDLVGSPYSLTQADIDRGWIDIQLSLAAGQYPVLPVLRAPGGAVIAQGGYQVFNVATATPATPYVAQAYDNTGGGLTVVGGTTTDATPVISVFMPGVSEATSPYSPGHPPFGNPSPIVGGTILVYADGVQVGSGTINYWGNINIETTPLAAGEYDITVIAVDKASNSSSVSAAFTLTIASPISLIRGTEAGEVLTGTAADDRIEGLGGNDQLSGGAGTDTLVGGRGDDWYIINDAADIIVENAGEGWDNIQASVSFTAPVNVEHLYLVGSAVIDGTGNGAGNQIRGNGAANVLSGLGGNDALQGMGGDDTLIGGAGDDSLEGGAGNDRYVFGPGSGRDRVIGFTSGDVLDFAAFAGAAFTLTQAGADAVFTFATGETVTLSGVTATTLRAGIDYVSVSTTHHEPEPEPTLNLIQGTAANDTLNGTAGADRIEGFAGNDAIKGGAGADVLVGGKGDDWYYLDGAEDTIIELAGEGWDNIWSTATITAAENVENVYLGGSAAVDATGNGLSNQLVGNGAANVLKGMAGADQISGGGGDDRLEGGAGNDVLSGGAGDDAFVFRPGFGSDRITGFTAGGAEDHMVFEGFGSARPTVTQSGADTLVSFGGGDQIVLVGVSAAALTDADWVWSA